MGHRVLPTSRPWEHIATGSKRVWAKEEVPWVLEELLFRVQVPHHGIIIDMQDLAVLEGGLRARAHFRERNGYKHRFAFPGCVWGECRAGAMARKGQKVEFSFQRPFSPPLLLIVIFFFFF